MAAPKTTLWHMDRHTKAKHGVLRKYLDRWIPILSTQAQRLALIDGFAGPGEYRGGQPGSPVIMLDAFTTHTQRADISSRARLEFVFVEAMRERYAHLVGEVGKASVSLPASWPKPEVVNGDFGTEVAPRLERLADAGVPVFLFVDPFGYTDPPPALTARLLGLRRCETLIFVPTNYIHRFLTDPGQELTFDRFFGRKSWRAAREMEGYQAVEHLVATFVERLHEDAHWIRTFEFETDENQFFHLFFATNNVRGYEKMKEAMWSVDPHGGTRFSDKTTPGQSVLFSETADLRILENQLRKQFPPGSWHRYELLERYTWDETAYLPKHLKEDLARMKRERIVNVIDEGPQGGMRPGSLIEFRSPQG